MTVRSFVDFLRDHGNGVTLDALSDKLNELVAAVTDQNKSGSLTISIKLKPAGNSGALEVGVDAKVKKPENPPGVSIFFATPENNLQRQDPRQSTMELREVPAMAFKGIA